MPPPVSNGAAKGGIDYSRFDNLADSDEDESNLEGSDQELPCSCDECKARRKDSIASATRSMANMLAMQAGQSGDVAILFDEMAAVGIQPDNLDAGIARLKAALPGNSLPAAISIDYDSESPPALMSDDDGASEAKPANKHTPTPSPTTTKAPAKGVKQQPSKVGAQSAPPVDDDAPPALIDIESSDDESAAGKAKAKATR